MAASTKDFVDVLNKLIETCKDGEQGFREAAEAVRNQEFRAAFDKYSRQRAHRTQPGGAKSLFTKGG